MLTTSGLCQHIWCTFSKSYNMLNKLYVCSMYVRCTWYIHYTTLVISPDALELIRRKMCISKTNEYLTFKVTSNVYLFDMTYCWQWSNVVNVLRMSCLCFVAYNTLDIHSAHIKYVVCMLDMYFTFHFSFLVKIGRVSVYHMISIVWHTLYAIHQSVPWH